MSRITLGKISTRINTNDSPNFYVAGITDSDSGFLAPRRFNDTSVMTEVLGEFKYKKMYEDLIDNGVPAVLTPILTQVSQYDLPSVRLNKEGAYIDHTHPRPKKNYEYTRLGNVTQHKITTPTNEVAIETLSKFPIPYLFTTPENEVDHDSILGARYIKNPDDDFYKLYIEFAKPVLGTLTIVRYPIYDSNPENIRIINLSDTHEFEIKNQVVPDIVVLDKDGNDVEYQLQITPTNEGYNIQFEVPDDIELTAYVRLLTDEMVVNQYVSSDITQIYHGLDYNPIIKPIDYTDDTADLFHTSVVYYTDHAEVLATADSTHRMVQYIKSSVGATIICNLNDEDTEYDFVLYDVTHPTAFRKIIPVIATFESEEGLVKDSLNITYGFEGGQLKLHVTTNNPRSGKLIITSFPNYENGDQYKVLNLYDTNRLYYNTDYVPDIVVLSMTDNHLVSHTINQRRISDTIYEIEIIVSNPESCIAYIRNLPEAMIGKRDLFMKNTLINYQGPLYPTTTALVDNGSEINYFSPQITYLNENNLKISIEDSISTNSLQYSIYVEEDGSNESISSVRLEADEIVYSSMIDFEKVTNDYIRKSKDNLYFIIIVGSYKILYEIINNTRGQILPSNYYDDYVVLNRSKILKSDNPKKTMLALIKQDLWNRISKKYAFDFRDECLRSLGIAWNYATENEPDGEPNSEDFDSTAFESWKDYLLESIYKEELFTGSYKILKDYIVSILGDLTKIAEFYNAEFELLDQWYSANFQYEDESKWVAWNTVDYWQWIDTVYDGFKEWKRKLMYEETQHDFPTSIITSIDTIINTLDTRIKKLMYDSSAETILTLPRGIKRYITDARVSIDELLDSVVTKDDLINGINTSSEFDTYKILINYQRPATLLNFSNIDGARFYSCFNSEQDILSDLTEEDKVIEIYSKIKGCQGKNIRIEIEKDESIKYHYYITVQLGSIIEEFNVYTVKTSEMPNEAMDVRLISGHSDLIDLVVYDYKLSNGKLIPQLNFIEYAPNETFDANNVIDIELPIGEFYLSRTCDEYSDYEDYQNTLESLSESGYYPDLFLSTVLFKDNQLQQLKDIYSYIRGSEEDTIGGCCSQGVYSQALVKLEWWYMQNMSEDKLIDANNRMLYFYDDVEVNDIQLPSYQSYIMDIFNGQVLRIPAEKVLADKTDIKVGNAVNYNGQPYLLKSITADKVMIESADGDIIGVSYKDIKSISEILDSFKINYLNYNNLYYYYTNLHEKNNQPSLFISQFTCSKISRGVYDWGRGLVSSNQSTLNQVMQNIVTRLLNCVSYVESINYDIEIDSVNRTALISITTYMSYLINKQFTINFLLNIS